MIEWLEIKAFQFEWIWPIQSEKKARKLKRTIVLNEVGWARGSQVPRNTEDIARGHKEDKQLGTNMLGAQQTTSKRCADFYSL